MNVAMRYIFSCAFSLAHLQNRLAQAAHSYFWTVFIIMPGLLECLLPAPINPQLHKSCVFHTCVWSPHIPGCADSHVFLGVRVPKESKRLSRNLMRITQTGASCTCAREQR
uniref:Uncharacterized protein n=1 Tax=Eutreptiella gymnastica TaxID=73025 RepID=A0A7S1N9Z9_9EUGL|mmetsp:Transcript_143172/g.249806  ORF Transcript_143172/g.249806 Transcript_143172/m.249806 type:complete len:111 (+) Transcript_143172:642-974(+)